MDLSKPIDISLPFVTGAEGVRAWGVAPLVCKPVVSGNFIGSVKGGGSVNFSEVLFAPHAHGTHTEGLGHISKQVYSVREALPHHFFWALLITLSPEKLINGDEVISIERLMDFNWEEPAEALIIRTSPNSEGKQYKNHTGTNFPYLSKSAAQFLVDKGIKHLLVDLPSVDKENDGGKLESHTAFLGDPNKPNQERTITELIFVPNRILDGSYLLNLQIANMCGDACPSRPILYKPIKN